MQVSEDFDAFVAIVEAGSISEAARNLQIPRASLSRQLARLEQRLDVRLLHRTTRSISLTPAGEALYPRARRLLDTATAAVEAVQRLDDVPRGRLRVSSAPLQQPMLGRLLSAYVQAYPGVEVELLTSARHIDLAAEGIDIALRGGLIRDQSLIATPLLKDHLLAVASPGYLESHGHPSTPGALKGHQCLRGYNQGLRPATAWPLYGGGKVSVDGPFVSNDIMALMGAALGGLGIALLPRHLVSKDLQDGRLLPVLEGDIGVGVTLSLVWLERKFMEPKVRAFIDLAVKWAKDGKLH